MNPSLRSSPAPVLPLLALGVVAFLNIMNRCADGYCYSFGWPWIAYRGFSDAQVNFGPGSPFHYSQPWVWSAVAADIVVAVGLTVVPVVIHFEWVRRKVG